MKHKKNPSHGHPPHRSNRLPRPSVTLNRQHTVCPQPLRRFRRLPDCQPKPLRHSTVNKWVCTYTRMAIYLKKQFWPLLESIAPLLILMFIIIFIYSVHISIKQNKEEKSAFYCHPSLLNLFGFARLPRSTSFQVSGQNCFSKYMAI